VDDGNAGLPLAAGARGVIGEPSLSPDGRRVVFWRDETNSIALYEATTSRAEPRLRARVLPGYTHIHPAFGGTASEILFQTGEGVYLQTGANAPQLLTHFRRGV